MVVGAEKGGPAMTLTVEQIDQWAKQKSARLTDWSSDFVMKGGDLNDPLFRKRLGEHSALMSLRSFISASKKREVRP